MTFEEVLAWDAATDWSSAEVAPGAESDLLAALQGLWCARSEEEAVAAYWCLDNVVVVQGSVYGGAVLVVGPAVRMAVLGSVWTRRWALELVLQVVAGWSVGAAVGDRSLVEQSRAQVRCSIDLVYVLLSDPISDVRELAAEVLACCEVDPQRFDERLAWAAGCEAVEVTRVHLDRVRSAGLRAEE